MHLSEQDNLQDLHYMTLALAEARKAFERDEVPVGAVVVYRGAVIGAAYNRREEARSPIAHAEILAIEQAAHRLGTWRLSESRLYVTLEPCIMCAGAILQARIGALVFGCLDPKAGAVDSLYRLCEDSRLNHTLPVTRGIMQDECSTILSDFFARLRTRKLSRVGNQPLKPNLMASAS
jgi:tRNA(adenine34) deaminase